MATIEPGWPHGDLPPARRMWSVSKDARRMEAEINPHPLGHELRVYVSDDLLPPITARHCWQAERRLLT
jgi:hypothetical protein